MTRKEKWKKFDEHVARWNSRTDLAPAFVQEIVNGLWAVQVLCHPSAPAFGLVHRLFLDPPSPTLFEPFYNGWPGDHRGWMRFESKVAARDFYRFASRRISFEEFQKLDHTPSSNVRVDLDLDGNFA